MEREMLVEIFCWWWFCLFAFLKSVMQTTNGKSEFILEVKQTLMLIISIHSGKLVTCHKQILISEN